MFTSAYTEAEYMRFRGNATSTFWDELTHFNPDKGSMFFQDTGICQQLE
jgi:hypothetical protein